MTATLHNIIENSALWAAAGDALGFITELASPEKVSERIGSDRVSTTVPWRRPLVPRFSSEGMLLPAGAYSDDTQLRLSVSRAIQANGRFDIDAFAKIELPVWASYALGAGRASKMAAANLAKRDVSWWNNFYDSKGSAYVNAGGNGGAMRIQPHVWTQALTTDSSSVIRDIVRDTIVTHGHPVAIFGAVIHGLSLLDAIQGREIPGPKRWPHYLSALSRIDEVIAQDDQLGQLWLGQWEQAAGQPYGQVANETRLEASRLMKSATRFADASNSPGPTAFLREIGAFEARTRGSALVTAIAALAIAWVSRTDSPRQTLVDIANTYGIDTDSVGTMTGAILGVIANRGPDFEIQDRTYIAGEARRSASIALNEPALNFAYPTLGSFSPPASQSDSVGTIDGSIGVVGLGDGAEIGETFVFDRSQWRWIELWFGQSILAKRRIGDLKEIARSRIPSGMRKGLPLSSQKRTEIDHRYRESHTSTYQGGVIPSGTSKAASERMDGNSQSFRKSIDDLFAQVEADGLTELSIGQAIVQCISSHGTVEATTALAAIIARAKIAELKRRAKNNI